MKRLVLSTLAGVVLGLGGTWLFAHRERGPVYVTCVPAPPCAPDAGCPACPPPVVVEAPAAVDVSPLRARRDELQRTLAQAAAAAEAVRIPFPAGGGGLRTEAQMRSAALQAFVGSPPGGDRPTIEYRVEGVDCSESPCLVFGVANDALSPQVLRPAMVDGRRYELALRGVPRGDGSGEVNFVLYDPPDTNPRQAAGAARGQRLEVRVQKLLQLGQVTP